MTLFTVVISLFFILNSLGNLPIFVGLLAHYPPHKQRAIIWRELLIALGILLLFNFCGELILNLLGISHAVLGISGGILLFLISLTMIFPKPHEERGLHKEPFIFPLAVPLIAGPAALTAVIIYGQQIHSLLWMTLGIILAWGPTALILILSSNIKHMLGQKGLLACERLGGMLICLLSVQMFTGGIVCLIQDNFVGK